VPLERTVVRTRQEAHTLDEHAGVLEVAVGVVAGGLPENADGLVTTCSIDVSCGLAELDV
jgi:hypothetical protein